MIIILKENYLIKKNFFNNSIKRNMQIVMLLCFYISIIILRKILLFILKIICKLNYIINRKKYFNLILYLLNN